MLTIKDIDPKILEAIANPEQIISPQTIVNLRIKLAELVDVLKEDIFEQKLKVSQKLSELRLTVNSDTIARAKLEQEVEWRDLHDLIRLKERLNGFRTDLKDKLILITGQKW
jgi:hypothetical protein